MYVTLFTHAECDEPLTVFGSGAPLRQFIYSLVRVKCKHQQVLGKVLIFHTTVCSMLINN